MEFKEFNKELKIKDTILDRRKKLTKSQIEEIKRLFNEGKSKADLAKQFNISYNSIDYHLASESEKVKRRINRMAYYYEKPEEERSEMNRQYYKSKEKYRRELFNTLVNNK